MLTGYKRERPEDADFCTLGGFQKAHYNDSMHEYYCPLTGEQMFTIMSDMAPEIDESIKVAAVFSRGEVRPVWFAWKGRQIRVSETTFTWKTREGSAVILHFSVTDGQGLYEICYNAESFGWRLMNAEGS
jgi:hypothetical protein